MTENLPEDLSKTIKTGTALWNKVSRTTGILKPINAWAEAKALDIKTKSEIRATEMRAEAEIRIAKRHRQAEYETIEETVLPSEIRSTL